jgi:5-methylcytosine-specific restriction endonuclease McrA
MANSWNIPDELERAVRERDKKCVYCGVNMKAYEGSRGSPRDKLTWEHIDNDEKNLRPWNICLCCNSCNSSKGSKKLSVWLKSPRWKHKAIKQKLAPIIRRFLAK